MERVRLIGFGGAIGTVLRYVTSGLGDGVSILGHVRGAACALPRGVACLRPVYRPRDAEYTVLHQVIGEHLEPFLRQAAEAGEGVGLPQFVEREFREFLTCGAFEHGFVRFRCAGCAHEHLVPFSCKGRGWCPSCGGRRMTERTAHLVDEVLPWVPVRQWVLTVPYRLRYLMAWDHGLSRAVLGVYARVLLDVYARGTQERGLRDGRSKVTVIQRAGSGLNLNLHFHTLALDGVFTEAHPGAIEFHPAPGPRDAEVAEVLATVRHRVRRLLMRRGLEPTDDATGPADRLAEESPVLAGDRQRLGPRAGGVGSSRRGAGTREAVPGLGWQPNRHVMPHRGHKAPPRSTSRHHSRSATRRGGQSCAMMLTS